MGGFAMGRTGIVIRSDFDAGQLRVLASHSRDANQARRLLSLAAIYDGMTRADAAIVGGMDRQTLGDWVVRFNDEGIDGLLNRKSPGRRRRLSQGQLEELDKIVEAGPDLGKDGVVRWRAIDLKRVIEARFGVSYGERHVMKLLNALGFSHISARPKHPKQNARVMGAFKKTSIKS
jgi:transposase